MSEPLVSVIMPAYNAEMYIAEAIQSVLDQHYPNFELLIINDGSVDNTKKVIDSFDDARIKYYEQKNKGVSTARNVGLDNMKGDFFCFLDADDTYTKRSLTSRLSIFEKNPSVSFVDGVVQKVDAGGVKVVDIWEPNFNGNPLEDLILLTGNSFFGPSWMIKAEVLKDHRFKQGMTHAEDLLFYLTLSRNDKYIYRSASEHILNYRVHSRSAMHNNLKKLEISYQQIENEISDWLEIPADLQRSFRKKTTSIMFKSYVRNGEIIRAIVQLIGHLNGSK